MGTHECGARSPAPRARSQKKEKKALNDKKNVVRQTEIGRFCCFAAQLLHNTNTHHVHPLALDVAPSGDARAAALASSGGGVDALPYVDTLSDAERARAERLVAAEVSVCV